MLDSLFAGALEDSLRRQQVSSFEVLEKRALEQKPPINVKQLFSSSEFVSVIAEIKRASPSKGLLAEIPNPGALASIYEQAGASAISVLTEERSFRGSLEDFSSVRANVKLPLLRKDFISTEYQVLEARAFGADMVLLIVAGLPREELQRLHGFIIELGMTPLVETHNEAEVKQAADLGAELVGINARDLSTFDTNRGLFAELATLLPGKAIKIAESAVRSVEDVVDYARSGADCVLIGEALVRGNANDLLREFSQIPKV